MASATPPTRSASVSRHDQTSSSSANRGAATSLTPPASARQSPDTARRRRTKASGHSRTGSSASRGREFRVGNIGNNGLIYLRPVNRSSQAPTSKTSSSLGTAGRQNSLPTDEQWRDSIASLSADDHRDSLVSASPPPAPRTPKDSVAFSKNGPPLSTTPKGNNSKTSPSRGTLKVVIDRATTDDAMSAPLYDVAIPHYRLGTPHFTGKGSAVLHSSINTGSSAMPSSRTSADTPVDRLPRARDFSVQTPPAERTRPSSLASSEPPALTPDRLTERRLLSSDVLFPRDLHKGAPVQPDVRLSPLSGQIVAASIPQLIVHITSPYRLDYDLLSDFFLTFRLFMAPGDLATALVQRLRASVGSGDEISRIVRVRTFVALRHWILNYFVDDFVSDLHLRIQFCTMVNNLCRDVREVNSQTVGDLRILGELKRCWKHTCALFWDVPVETTADHMEQDIYPGGVVGSRSIPQDLPVDPPPVPRDASPVRRPSVPTPPRDYSPSRLSTRDTQATPNFAFNQTSALQSSISLRHAPRKIPKAERHSMQVLSCTIPTHANKLLRNPSTGPRPVPSAGVARAQPKKNQQAGDPPRRPHKRSGSFSDALRDDRAPLPAPHASDIGQNQPVQMIIPGSLIRGAMISPAAPYVESVMPRTPIGPAFESHTTHAAEDGEVPDIQERQSHFANPGVRRFIGSVRRALSVKNYTTRPLSSTLEERNSSYSSLASRGPYMAAPLPEPGVPRRKLIGGQTRLRVDLLAAEISEAFNAAVEEASEAQRHAMHGSDPQLEPGRPDLVVPEPGPEAAELVQRPSPSHKVHSNVTMGSRSIVIMDDTNGQVTPRPEISEFDIRRSERIASNRQDVPLFLDNDDSPAEFFYIDGDGNTIPRELVATPRLVDAHFRSSQLSTAHNLHDVTAVSLREKLNQSIDPSYDGTLTYSENTSTNDPFNLERTPMHHLRRMPGGDLRAAQHVHSLDHGIPSLPLRRLSASALQTPAEKGGPEGGARLAPPNSQPMLRPSFENEVARLADIPDPTEEGGIESALRRLEGRSSRDNRTEPGSEESTAVSQTHGPNAGSGSITQHSRSKSKAHRAEQVVEVPPGEQPDSPGITHIGSGAAHADDTEDSERTQVVVQSKALSRSNSDASHSSVPLLERGTSHPPAKRKNADLSAMMADDTDDVTSTSESYKSLSVLEDTTHYTMHKGGNAPRKSFLLDENQSLSSLSSTSPDEGDSNGPKSAGMRSFFEDGDGDGSTSQDGGRATPRPEVPRPENPTGRSSTTERLAHARTRSEDNNTPAQRSVNPSLKSKSVNDLLPTEERVPLATSLATTHMCFILAFDSQVLAQQFTVVERDALCEVEWRELIDLRWHQVPPQYTNWVSYLRSKGSDPNGFESRAGVDMCIARFNLVIRWAKSEIVLTEDINERAATIIKYVHVAQHSRRLRNWATMYQITLALVGSDISRLKRTWELVPVKERETLAELEELIMPLKNFSNLREEVESATETFAQDGDGGCIPFIGIYTHDLLYNAQKPLYVSTGSVAEGTPSGYPPSTLVNFERHHTAATIVKNLLRLIEASSKYTFQPVPEIASRCLWLGALTDEEVSLKSLALEPPGPRATPTASHP